MDDRRVSNMFVKNNINDMILKMKQNERNFQTIFKNMEIKIDEWSRSQNISSEQTDRTEPQPPPQAQTEQVNAVFARSGKSSDFSEKLRKLHHRPIILTIKSEGINLLKQQKRNIKLYCRGKENGVNILKSIDEGPFQMGTFRETLAEGTEGALHLGPERPRVYSDLSPKDKERYNADIRATNILLQGLPKDIYTLINHYTDAKDIWDNVNMLLEGSELTKEDRESQLMQLNSKFVNNMLPEWGRFVTAVRLNRGLRDSNYDQLNQATVQDGRVMVQNVQGRQNKGQGNNPLGGGATGYGGAQNRVGNTNPGQARQIKCYKLNAQENGVALDEEQLLFLAGGQDDTIIEDVDEQPVHDLALNVDNVFQVNDYTTVYDESVHRHDSDILSDGTDHLAQYQDVFVKHHEEYEMHDDVQPNYVVDSHADYTSDSNMIPYDQYIKDNAVPVVQGNASSVPNDAYIMIYNDMYEPHAQSVSKTTRNTVVDNSLTAELATYKEQVKLYERRARFELMEREQKIDEQLRIVITDRNIKEENLKKELHSVKLQLASGASGSSQLPPPPPPPSTNQSDQSTSTATPSSLKTSASAEYTAWTTTDTRLKPSVSSIPEDLHMDDDMAPDKQVHLSGDEDIGHDHIPTVNLKQNWWKPLTEDNPATPEHAWSIPSSDFPVPMNNWASALVSTYVPSPENSLLAQTGDMAIFMDWFCKKQGITELKQQDLEGPAYEIVKVFHPNVIHLQYQIEECHKLLTNQVYESIIRYNVSKPLPLGGPPGQVTIQSDFFFNKDLEYLRYGRKSGRPALSISKMKAAYYPDVGLEQIVPDQMWIEEECKYDIAAIYGISHWWFQRQRFYIDRHTSEGDRRAVRTHMRILSVVRFEVFSLYGYDYMKTIILRRADLNEYIIAEKDFKYLYLSDLEIFNLWSETGVPDTGRRHPTED
ncbi:hypothetical protein Tco_1069482 [Tanacetum coccineum]|uniref:Integrase, catalytic region, zinc finger, CCHC-type, peptidase aspartic, catalytic n=1 Tax=Tanacetum coccineum TaxID=301880 RepID=A0ABQ5HKK3_9ASTR